MAGKSGRLYVVLPDYCLGANFGGNCRLLCVAGGQLEAGSQRTGLDRVDGGGHDYSATNDRLANTVKLAHHCQSRSVIEEAVAIEGVR